MRKERYRTASRKRVGELLRDLLLTLLFAAILVGVGYGLQAIW